MMDITRQCRVCQAARLKCTQDNERGNAFYASAGMTLVGSESGKHRALNIWKMLHETA